MMLNLDQIMQTILQQIQPTKKIYKISNPTKTFLLELD